MQTKINLSTIEHKLASSAFGLFRIWTKQMNIATKIHIKDEQILVDDLKNTLKNALIALFEKDRSDKPLGWDIGFILGFVSGNLGYHWNYEYIVKNSDIYKELAALKAIQSYLEFDEVVKIKINELYFYMLKHDANIENMNLNVVKSDFEVSTLKEIKTNEQGKIEAIVNNLIVTQIKKITQIKNHSKLEVDTFFSVDEIRKLIIENKKHS